MFKYLIMTAEQLVFAGLIIGMLLSYVRTAYDGRMKRIMQGFFLAGVVAAIAMAYTKNATSKINTGIWNLGIFSVTLAASLFFYLFMAVGIRFKKAGAVLSTLMAGVIMAMLLFYVLPDALSYPYVVYTAETTIFSTTYLLKFIGVVLGFILVFLAGLAVYKAGLHLGKGGLLGLLTVLLLVNAFKEFSSMISIMLARRFIASNHTLFVLAKYASNYSDLFIYAALIVSAIVAVTLWIRSFHVNEPYSNPAQKRKIKAKWRNIRRWSTTILVCGALVVLHMTVIDSIVNAEAEIAPVEDAAMIQDGNVYVSFDQVNDGHLHRFGYTTENGITVRFIVMQKSASSYGVGLDACDICGETGYYEKNGQVVCSLCDVVMNINTIGFKGGCNPIVIDYSVANGYIVVPIEGLVENESEFK